MCNDSSKLTSEIDLFAVYEKQVHTLLPQTEIFYISHSITWELPFWSPALPEPQWDVYGTTDF